MLAIKKMTDREALLLAYGALKAIETTEDILELIEDHLFKPEDVKE